MSRTFKKITQSELEQICLDTIIKNNPGFVLPQGMTLELFMTHPWKWNNGYPKSYKDIEFDEPLNAAFLTI